jgi:hypothetical protein
MEIVQHRKFSRVTSVRAVSEFATALRDLAPASHVLIGSCSQGARRS